MLGFLVGPYFSRLLALAGTAFMIGGYRSYPRAAKTVWFLSHVWLVGAPFAYNRWLAPSRTTIVQLHLRRNICECLLRIRPQSMNMSAAYAIQLGASGTGPIIYLVGGVPTDNGPLSVFARRMSLHFDRDNKGGVLVSAKIRDKSGEIVALLDNGKLETFSNDLGYEETDNTFEITNKAGRIALQLRLLPDRLQLQGESWDTMGHGIRIAGALGGGASITFLDRDNDPDDPRVQSLFGEGQYAHQPITTIENNPTVAESDQPICIATVIYGTLVFIAPLALFVLWLCGASPHAVSSRGNGDGF